MASRTAPVLWAALALVWACGCVLSQEPVFQNLPATIQINETATGPELLYEVDVTDSNSPIENITFQSGNDGNFEIFPNGSVFLVANPPNLDADPGGTTSYSLEVWASDGENITTQTLTIDVNAVNEVPAVTGLPNSVTLDESDLSSRIIQTVGADPAVDEEGHTLSYDCTFIPDDGSFFCDSDDGDIHTSSLPNYTVSAYEIQVRLFDTIDYGEPGILSVTINNIWGDPPRFSNLPNDTTVFEDLEIGSLLYTIGVYDPDNTTLTPAEANITLTILSITNGDNTTFFLNGTNLYLNAELSFETATTHDIEIQACDDDGCVTEIFTVTVEDVPEPPDVEILELGTIPENTPAPYQVLIKYNISDEDGDTVFSFALDGSPEGALFDIDPASGNITFTSAAQLDCEDLTNTDGALSFNVLVIDPTLQTATVPVSVVIDDINEFDPAFDAPDYLIELEEGVHNSFFLVPATDGDCGSVFGAITECEVDPPGSDYVIAEPAGDGSGCVLSTWKTLDLEAIGENDLTFTVYAKDGGGRQDSTSVRLRIIDVNESPPVASDKYSFRINSNAPIGRLVGLLDVVDPDLDDRLIFHQISNASLPFFISYLDGQIFVNGVLEPDTIYRFSGYVEDSGGLTSEVFDIEISTFDGARTLVDWEIETDEYYYPEDIAQFEANLKATCEPCTPVVASQYTNELGNTVLQVYILKGSSTDTNPDYMTTDEQLRLYTKDRKKTPTDESAALAPKGTVVSINEAYKETPPNWFLDTVEGNVVLALLCFIGAGLLVTMIVGVLDVCWWSKRPERRRYENLERQR